MLKRKSPSHTAKRGTAEVDFGVGLVPMFPTYQDLAAWRSSAIAVVC